MSKVLIVGAGGVGQVVAHKCAQLPEVFSEITLASRTEEKCRRIAAQIERPIRTAQVDAVDGQLVESRLAEAHLQQRRRAGRLGPDAVEAQADALRMAPHATEVHAVEQLCRIVVRLVVPRLGEVARSGGRGESRERQAQRDSVHVSCRRCPTRCRLHPARRWPRPRSAPR